MATLDLAAVRAAAERIAPYAHRTPLMHARSLDDAAGAEVWFKCENFQRVGAFKFRGACNAVMSLSADERACGVATHSSGNHGAALALAARECGVTAHVVMPDNAVATKKAAVAGYGATVHYCEATMQGRERMLAQVVQDTGAIYIPPYDDYRIMAGQGTAALELLTDQPQFDAVLTPIGGGGLLSGTAVVVKGLNPAIRVIGAEPSGADDAARALHAGKRIEPDAPDTIADGLRATVGKLTFPVIQALVDDIITVDDDETLRAMRFVWERFKIVIEPSSAVPVAVLLARKLPEQYQRIAVIITGGNVDFP